MFGNAIASNLVTKNFKIFLCLPVHSVCFISNVYKQQFFQQVKIFKNLSNSTSRDFDAKQHVCQMVKTTTLGDLLVMNLRKLFWNVIDLNPKEHETFAKYLPTFVKLKIDNIQCIHPWK